MKKRTSSGGNQKTYETNTIFPQVLFFILLYIVPLTSLSKRCLLVYRPNSRLVACDCTKELCRGNAYYDEPRCTEHHNSQASSMILIQHEPRVMGSQLRYLFISGISSSLKFYYWVVRHNVFHCLMIFITTTTFKTISKYPSVYQKPIYAKPVLSWFRLSEIRTDGLVV